MYVSILNKKFIMEVLGQKQQTITEEAKFECCDELHREKFFLKGQEPLKRVTFCEI
jgi:hypothetical protein